MAALVFVTGEVTAAAVASAEDLLRERGLTPEAVSLLPRELDLQFDPQLVFNSVSTLVAVASFAAQLMKDRRKPPAERRDPAEVSRRAAESVGGAGVEVSVESTGGDGSVTLRFRYSPQETYVTAIRPLESDLFEVDVTRVGDD
jgi:hypothetical protein